MDDSEEGFVNWKFMSVASWGEDPRGIWRLEISDSVSARVRELDGRMRRRRMLKWNLISEQVGPRTNEGILENLTLILHGTEVMPNRARYGQRIYNDEYNRMRKTVRPNTRRHDFQKIKKNKIK